LVAAYLCEQARELVGIHRVAALAVAQQAAELEPWNPRLQSVLGRVALRAGRTDEALAAYRHAIDGDHYRASYWWQLADAKTTAHGVDAEALRLLIKAVELNPTNVRYTQALAAAKESVRQSAGSLLQSDPAREAGSSK